MSDNLYSYRAHQLEGLTLGSERLRESAKILIDEIAGMSQEMRDDMDGEEMEEDAKAIMAKATALGNLAQEIFANDFEIHLLKPQRRY